MSWKSMLKLGLVIVIMFVSAEAVYAQTEPGFDNDNWSHPCEGAQTTDECMWDDSYQASGGNYIQCTAKGEYQYCQKVVRDTVTGARFCASVQFNANCNCDPQKLTATGNCAWYR